MVPDMTCHSEAFAAEESQIQKYCPVANEILTCTACRRKCHCVQDDMLCHSECTPKSLGLKSTAG